MQGEGIWKNKQHKKFIGTPCTLHGARLFGGVRQKTSPNRSAYASLFRLFIFSYGK
jgi:hypothetical protein